MNASLRAYLLGALLPLLLVSCGKQEGYEIRGEQVIWYSWQGDGLCGKWSEGVLTDSKGFEILRRQGYARTPAFTYCAGREISGSDPATFQILDKREDMGKDAKQVYLKGGVIEGADPATIVVDPSDTENASDKNRRYRCGEPVP